MDIVEVILYDHHEQRRRFALLDEMHGCGSSDLDAVWKLLRILLEVHAKAEEELFYPELMELGRGAGGKDSAGDETADAISDHDEIRDAIAEVAQHPAVHRSGGRRSQSLMKSTVTTWPRKNVKA